MSVSIDIDKAKDIWRDKWRQERKPLLENLDVEFMRAVEAGDATLQSQIATSKQELRDITETDLSEVDNIKDLQTVWPSALNDLSRLNHI